MVTKGILDKKSPLGSQFGQNPKLQQDEEYIITLDNIDTVYSGESNPSLFDVTLRISRGEFVFIVGPNGSGKTTLLETILGLLQVNHGQFQVFNLPISKAQKIIRKKIGYVLQSFEISPDLPFLVKDVVMIGRAALVGAGHRPKKQDWGKVNEALDLVGMLEYRKRPIGKLSGGQQQKILIAQALCKDPEILLLDEPFANLDLESQESMLELFREMNQRMGTTILMVSHATQIPTWIDRVVMIQHGQVVVNAPRSYALEHPLMKNYMRMLTFLEVEPNEVEANDSSR
ncbi:MAG: metal ABC transporter ATP-binding protein [Promethearchaeota archaeon]